MLFHLFDWILRLGGPDVLRFFRYTTTRILAAAITSLLISFLIGPWFIERLKQAQIGQQIREEGPQSHKKKAGTPTMGGSLILLALVIPTILWCDLKNRFVWVTLAVTVGYGAVGFVDDYLKVSKKNTKGLAGRLKLAWMFAIGGAALAYIFLSTPTIRSSAPAWRSPSPTSTGRPSTCRSGSTWGSPRSWWSAAPTPST